eukprot:408407-Rhodomonas_salina.3
MAYDVTWRGIKMRKKDKESALGEQDADVKGVISQPRLCCLTCAHQAHDRDKNWQQLPHWDLNPCHVHDEDGNFHSRLHPTLISPQGVDWVWTNPSRLDWWDWDYCPSQHLST